jgi:tight adherence protein C
MTAITLLGAGVGVGLWLIVRAISARTSLTDVGTTLASPGRPVLTPIVSSRSIFEQRLVSRSADFLQAVGFDPTRRSADLRVARRSVDQHVMSKLTMALAFGGCAGLLLVLSPAPAGIVVIGAVGAAALGFLVPEWILTSEANEARNGFRHAFGAYLDLVNVMLAAGAGPEEALYTAADNGGGWAFAEIRGTLASARSRQRPIADALSELGKELEISELSDFAASVALTGSQGARIRSTLVAKADSLRAKQIAETRSEADNSTEKMTMPVALLLLGFILFLGYPAVVAINNVGGGP